MFSLRMDALHTVVSFVACITGRLEAKVERDIEPYCTEYSRWVLRWPPAVLREC